MCGQRIFVHFAKLYEFLTTEYYRAVAVKARQLFIIIIFFFFFSAFKCSPYNNAHSSPYSEQRAKNENEKRNLGSFFRM